MASITEKVKKAARVGDLLTYVSFNLLDTKDERPVQEFGSEIKEIRDGRAVLSRLYGGSVPLEGIGRSEIRYSPFLDVIMGSRQVLGKCSREKEREKLLIKARRWLEKLQEDLSVFQNNLQMEIEDDREDL